MQRVNARVGLCNSIDDVTSPVGRPVIHDQNVYRWALSENRWNYSCDVFPLVVRRDYHKRSLRQPFFAP